MPNDPSGFTSAARTTFIVASVQAVAANLCGAGRQATNGVRVHSAKVEIVNIRKLKRKHKDGGHRNYYLEIEGIIQKGI